MLHQICPDCGSKIYKLGCVVCDEQNYIDAQIAQDHLDSKPMKKDKTKDYKDKKDE